MTFLCLCAGAMGFQLYLAPMLDVTTPHFRRLVRLTGTGPPCSPRCLWQMLCCTCPGPRFLSAWGPSRRTLSCRSGGSCPDKVAGAVRVIQESLGFQRFNLNCGCPSSRVRSGGFGAVLMLFPSLVAEIITCVEKTSRGCPEPQIWLGVDEHDSYEFVHSFVRHIVDNTSCTTFFVHARKCVLGGLSPARTGRCQS